MPKPKTGASRRARNPRLPICVPRAIRAPCKPELAGHVKRTPGDDDAPDNGLKQLKPDLLVTDTLQKRSYGRLGHRECHRPPATCFLGSSSHGVQTKPSRPHLAGRLSRRSEGPEVPRPNHVVDPDDVHRHANPRIPLATSPLAEQLTSRTTIGRTQPSHGTPHVALGWMPPTDDALYGWSGRGDSNTRPSAPKADALPGCATPRWPCCSGEVTPNQRPP
jgi:hypothetical protein